MAYGSVHIGSNHIRMYVGGSVDNGSKIIYIHIYIHTQEVQWILAMNKYIHIYTRLGRHGLRSSIYIYTGCSVNIGLWLSWHGLWIYVHIYMRISAYWPWLYISVQIQRTLALTVDVYIYIYVGGSVDTGLWLSGHWLRIYIHLYVYIYRMLSKHSLSLSIYIYIYTSARLGGH